ncbi:uncharacterized protein METZ01_LOCUS12276 [marine metagenome]|uniref:Uncharacterized protein n=1 Tax=marine metagenome TaxID=408172 RepID=A0A381NXS8_9ZZZZ
MLLFHGTFDAAESGPTDQDALIETY